MTHASPAVAAVLDTGAITAYMGGESIDVGGLLAGAALRHQWAVVPALCLAAAYREATPEQALRLDILMNLPTALIPPVVPGDAPVLGGWSRITEQPDLAHALLEAVSRHAPLVTTRREVATRVLPKEWPIIEV
ncbi:hypothetical protein [Catenuloplanes atrovinosus]|uniref:Uncharacterized protein n=1 Tax=Catenuloplanes atrovinosus TaxID=137266 RepID=A0AAE4CEL9_9ACTN|nr:hypothetical protein [Catenuloplanes atrovinosus]MDR7278760.1 hypothetical protein [Catenuloplanes atrovinosus]